MALIKCPECDGEVSDRAATCPHCGYPIRGGSAYEYRSERQLFGLPLVHIVSGNRIDPATGRLHVAKGIIAIGPVAVGALALGGVSVGVLSFGGLSLGLIALGGAALGVLLAVGGGAVGFVALGGGVIGYYALGGGGLAVHVLGGHAQTFEVFEFFGTHWHLFGGRR
jgi:hypothetical protein